MKPSVYRHSLTYAIIKFWKTSTGWILHKWKLGCAYCELCTCIKTIPVEIQTQHFGMWMATAWPPCHLCYCPAVFFLFLRIISLSFQQGKIWCVFKKCCNLNNFTSYACSRKSQKVPVRFYVSVFLCACLHVSLSSHKTDLHETWY
jgi:hypothetical protein